VGLAITKDFKTIEEKHPVTFFNAKAMTLFPEKIDGKIVGILAANTDMPPVKIGLAFFDKEEDIWSNDFWEEWYSNLDNNSIRLERDDEDHVEIGAPPIKTDEGWLLVYSHIDGYFTQKREFGVEALLLDLENPFKIIGRTKEPFLVPEESYEVYGMVPDIVFPSGAIIKDDKLMVYYGAADTVCALAAVDLKELLDEMKGNRPLKLERFRGGPILVPDQLNDWEAKAVFNPAAVVEDGKIHIVYRAMSHNNTSVMGYAMTENGFDIKERLSESIYVPREDFEKKLNPGGNSGCEDPRITKLDDRFYMFYTAFNGKNPPRVALTSISISVQGSVLNAIEREIIVCSVGFISRLSSIFFIVFSDNPE